MKQKKKKVSINLRFNFIYFIIYLVGIIFVVQLFNLQILNGAQYRAQSNTRLARDSIIKATRGDILDSSGETLVTSDIIYNIEIYKTKISDEQLNNSLFELINLMEKYNIDYPNNLPINIEDMSFTISDEALENFYKKNKIEEGTSADETFYILKDKYNISYENIIDIRKVMNLRYEIANKGYSQTNGTEIAKDIPREAVNEINESYEKFPGVSIAQVPIRVYPNGEMASHILGYASKISSEQYQKNKEDYRQDDIIGNTGIEAVCEQYLKGTNGRKRIEMSMDGTITSEYNVQDAVAGSNVVLTIDSKLQKITEEQLAQNIEKIKSGGFAKTYDAKGGVAIVMNVKTGEILSMASYPNYNPQLFTNINGISQNDWVNYTQSPLKPLVNKAIQNVYSPGSIFKMVTAIAALETNTIDVNTKINDTGVYTNHNVNMKCWYYTDYKRGHGYLNVIGAIEKSCNYFFYKVADDMGIDNLSKYARYFGLGSYTGIELPSEAKGILAQNGLELNGQKVTIYPGDVLNAAIGQGYNSFTPLQIVQYISILANKGKQISPTIIKSIQRQDGTEISKKEIQSYISEQIGKTASFEDLNISEQNLNIVLEGMKNVTSDDGGTANNVFKDFEITVGGKTGSAEAQNDEVNAWFVGFAPFEEPEIAVVVMVENGGKGGYTAEAVREIMKEYFGMNKQEVEESIEAIPYTQKIK